MQCVVNETVSQKITILFNGILTSQYSSFLQKPTGCYSSNLCTNIY